MAANNLVMHLVRVRPRLVAAIALGIAATLATPANQPAVTQFLIGWNIGVWSYLLLAARLMARADASRVKAIADREDATAEAVLVFMSVAAMISLAAIVLELAAVKTIPSGALAIHYALTGSTLLGSWLLVNVMFTLHYAHMYYRAPADWRPIRFPGHDAAEPDYWDFLYFSFTIAVAAQTSDATVMTRNMRKVVVAQSVLSFLFNAAIIGLSINVAAGLIGA